MLQIREISKEYRMGGLVQKALDKVSLNLRDSEFVAVLGPSGSGKTTLLNIIGGLDRYDSGDLIINGVSTKEYTDRDWDTYRNHTVGFVFQSYHLIPHQNILSNVELALTIAGVSRTERRERAEAALRKVGLGDQMQKKPSQLSGGQMQRVAIARALVNNPDIVLADEPTGALDSDTSVQVMDLLEEVAKDRLVVMVTHNPDLAHAYATRIVNLRDGRIISDSDPYEIPAAGIGGKTAVRASKAGAAGAAAAGAAAGAGAAAAAPGSAEKPKTAGSAGENPEGAPDTKQTGRKVTRDAGGNKEVSAEAKPGKKRRSSMSFLTALSLSFNNLWSKKTRTLLTAIAGSIGIIGIALILSVSNGANNYVKDIEAETMSEYPIQVQKTSLNFSAMFASGTSQGDTEEGVVNVDQVLGDFLLTMDSNDLTSLKEYLDSGESGIEEYATAVEYIYSVTPQVYRLNEDGTIHQVNPDQSFEELYGLTSSSSSNSLVSDYLSSDVFFQMPENEELYEEQYDLKAGRWPENYNECVLVLTEDGSINDWLLYAMGLRDQDEYDEIMSEFLNEEDMDIPLNIGPYEYDEVLGITFKVVNSFDYYEYDEEYGTWVDKSADEDYMEELVADGEDLEIVGIVQPSEDASGASLSAGINYPSSLITHLVEEAADSEIVKEQMEDPDTNVLTGEPFSDKEESSLENLAELFDIDEEALAEAFALDTEAIEETFADSADLSDSMDLSSVLDMSSLESLLPEMDLSSIDLSGALEDVDVEISSSGLQSLMEDLIAGYDSYADQNPEADYTSLGDDFSEYLQTDSAQAVLSEYMLEILEESGGITVSTEALESLLNQILTGYMEYAEEQGYDDWSDPDALLDEYMETDSAQQVLSSWAAESLETADSLTVPEDTIEELASALSSGYQSYASSNGLFDPSSMDEYILAYLGTDSAQSIITSGVDDVIDTESLASQISTALQDEMEEQMSSYAGELESTIESESAVIADEIASQVSAAIEESIEEAFSSGTDLASLMDINEEALLAAMGISEDTDMEDLLDLLSSLTSSGSTSYEDNLEEFGYAEFDDPSEIDIYPVDFESKDEIEAILDDYNERMEEEGNDGQVVSYVDSVGTMMSSVTEIINVISYVLIAFVAISLIVSSIMIGVITHISVLERRQEIGILRAIGASKRNISQVFNAETFIIGLAAGILGVVITIILQFPVNSLIHRFTGTMDINASLPVGSALLLILLSVALTLISGLIPARKAAKSDPVAALRSE